MPSRKVWQPAPQSIQDYYSGVFGKWASVVGQAFEPAGFCGFPAARRGWKAPLTGRLESPPYDVPSA